MIKQKKAPAVDVPQFSYGDYVLAKVKGWPYWPSEVKETVRENVYKVVFFGTKDTAIVDADKIVVYSRENCEKYNKASQINTKKFKEAINALEEIRTFNEKLFADLESKENVPSKADLNQDVEPDEIPESSLKSNIRTVKRELKETCQIEPENSVKIEELNPDQVDLLRTQLTLLESTYIVRKNLGLEKRKVNVEEALDNLQKIQEVLPESTQFMIFKYPDILWTQQKLCDYKGNIEHWKMSKKALENWTTKTSLIKDIAKRNVEIIQEKIAVDPALSFQQAFDEESALIVAKRDEKNIDFDSFFKVMSIEDLDDFNA